MATKRLTIKRKTDRSFEMVAQTQLGLEPVLAAELRELGAESVDFRPRSRAVNFRGTLATLYEANLWLRTALRILKPIRTAQTRDESELYRRVQEIDWSRYLDVRDTLAIQAIVHSPHFNHTKYVALKSKDAIVDQFRNNFGRRPSVDTENPDLRIIIYISGDQCTISLDSSGESLHRRGYRLARDIAPLNEVLAAGMVLRSGWRGDTPFVDPMCGSGTLPIEAGMIAARIAPGLRRERFGFMQWRDFDRAMWTRLQRKAETARIPVTVPILGGDISEAAIKVSQNNLRRTMLGRAVTLKQGDFADLTPPPAPGMLIVNPPYGERIRPDDLMELYSQIGDTLKQRFTDYDAWIISSNPAAMKRVGLRASSKMVLMNGSLECRYQHYELYRGTKASTT